MVDLYCNVKNNLSNVGFEEEQDDAFCEWVSDKLYSQFNDFELDDTPEMLEGISNIHIFINNPFDSYDHTMDLRIEVDTGLSEDELADYGALFEYLESEMLPNFVAEFNRRCDLTFPMTYRDTFNDMEFDGENFLVKAYSAGGEYKLESIHTVQFELYEDFDIGI